MSHRDFCVWRWYLFWLMCLFLRWYYFPSSHSKSQGCISDSNRSDTVPCPCRYRYDRKLPPMIHRVDRSYGGPDKSSRERNGSMCIVVDECIKDKSWFGILGDDEAAAAWIQQLGDGNDCHRYNTIEHWERLLAWEKSTTVCSQFLFVSIEEKNRVTLNAMRGKKTVVVTILGRK